MRGWGWGPIRARYQKEWSIRSVSHQSVTSTPPVCPTIIQHKQPNIFKLSQVNLYLSIEIYTFIRKYTQTGFVLKYPINSVLYWTWTEIKFKFRSRPLHTNYLEWYHSSLVWNCTPEIEENNNSISAGLLNPLKYY